MLTFVMSVWFVIWSDIEHNIIASEKELFQNTRNCYQRVLVDSPEKMGKIWKFTPPNSPHPEVPGSA